MAFDAETIKSYLVSLGFSVDNKGYDRFQQYLNEADRFVDRHVAGIAKSYLTASTAIVAALAAVTTSTVALMDGVAQADLGYQKFALHMFMGVRQAREMKIATDALGESLQDIAWMPELRGRYFELMREERGLDNPLEAGGAESAYRHMRDIRFEWTRLKMEMTYGARYIGYYLMRYLAGPAGTIESKFKQLNDWLQTNMPVWTSKIAQVLTTIIGLGKSAVRFAGDLLKPLKTLWESLDKGGKAFMVLGGILTAFFVAGPFGQAMMILSGLILLIDDFYAYIDGRKSSATLAPIWQTLAPVFHEIATAADSVVKGIAHVIDSLAGASGAIEKFLQKHNILSGIFKVFATGIEAWAGNWDVTGEMLQGKSGKEAYGRIWDTIKGIWSTESGGDYNAINKDTGAAGKYQIMPQNWTAWSIEAGLPAGSPMTPSNQDVVATFKLNQYSKEFGGDQRLVAAAWYAGPGYARSLQAGHPLFDPNAPQWKNGTEYPSVNQYIQNATGQAWGSNTAYLQRGAGNVSVDNSVSVGDIHVMQPNASADEIQSAVIKAIEEKKGKATARQAREFAGIHG